MNFSDSNDDLDIGFMENTHEEEQKGGESLEELTPQYPLILPSIETESRHQEEDVQSIEVEDDGNASVPEKDENTMGMTAI